MSKFEAGKHYKGRSICDAECVISILVMKRTAKTLTTSGGKTLRISERSGGEFVMPWGRYSMAPTISAGA